MLDRYEVYSPRRAKKRTEIIWTVAKIISGVFLLYIVVTHFFVSPLAIESESMKPGLETGERVLSSPMPYGIFIPFAGARLSGFQKPQRGDLVVLTPPYIKQQNPFAAFFEPAVRFFTLQQGSLTRSASGERLYTCKVKRVIAVPGDTVKMESFVAFIKPAQSESFLREDELIKKPYVRHIPQGLFPEEWASSFPFSGNAGEILLKENEYFVLGDNRPNSNDSRSWGPVDFSGIYSRVVARIWPLTKISGF